MGGESGQGVMRSKADLRGRLPPKVAPGVYRLERVGFITYSRKRFSRRGEELRKAASMRLEVVLEPDEKPGLEGLDFL